VTAKNYLECTTMVYFYDDKDMGIVITSQNNKNRIQRIYNIRNYVEHIVLSFSSESFKSHFW